MRTSTLSLTFRDLAFRAAALAGLALLTGNSLAQSGPATAPAAAEQKAAIDVTGAWTRATPGRSPNAAVYMRIINAGAADTLNGVETENAQRAVVHTTTMTGGTAQMSHVTTLPIPRAATVTMAPGGSHVMLEGLKAPLRQGESFIVTLVFAKAGKISTTVKVMDADARGPAAETATTPAPPPAAPAPSSEDR
jgi:periplasmic copper chaperone A